MENQYRSMNIFCLLLQDKCSSYILIQKLHVLVKNAKNNVVIEKKDNQNSELFSISKEDMDH